MSSATEVVLRPGDFEFVEGPVRLRTLLGSCVAITMWHPEHRHGGMCHYMLPTRGPARAGLPPDGRYADEAMDLFLEGVERRWTRLEEYEAKVFGGGEQFGPGGCRGELGVPARNVDAALRLLDEHNIAVQACNVGGSGPREIAFDVTTGVVWHRLVDDPDRDEVLV
ncbi:MAG: chemotaxis protein CheD [Actinobacteria bacterium]|nr:chemotaxis protein CheD [Actinomycetota bacterium]MCG2797272.1 chemotaxis protein CheD [Cellulomonas sp.]